MSGETQSKELNPVIPVRDIRAALAFYEGEFGFSRAFDDAGGDDEKVSYAGVWRGGLCIHLQAMAPDKHPSMPLIRIRVEHIDPLYEEYRERGLIGSRGHLEAKPWGSKDFGVYDVNGAALVFYEDV